MLPASDDSDSEQKHEQRVSAFSFGWKGFAWALVWQMTWRGTTVSAILIHQLAKKPQTNPKQQKPWSRPPFFFSKWEDPLDETSYQKKVLLSEYLLLLNTFFFFLTNVHLESYLRPILKGINWVQMVLRFSLALKPLWEKVCPQELKM